MEIGPNVPVLVNEPGSVFSFIRLRFFFLDFFRLSESACF